ncbi:MAG: hypothetical protein LBJ35_02160 [Spirochaetaceae bacterium]|jgi:hypothetical protein|nr:hypothetical protein [Spirochaetaceae bacterium]
MGLKIENCKIRLAKRTSQSVNICLEGNEDFYESYLIKAPYVLSREDMQKEIERYKTIPDFINWLQNDRHAISLGIRERNNTVAMQPSRYFLESDKDIKNIANAVEESINKLIDQFIESPYLHRVESSIHTELFHIMKQNNNLSQCFSLGDNSTRTQLIHNEWPSSDPKYGNYDFAIMTPELLQKDCPNADIFSRGKFNVPIVVELGLNPSDPDHLKNDNQKIIANKIHAGYLVHLIREKPENSVDEKIILDTRNPNIKTAYALINNEKIRYKYVNDTGIIETTTAARMPPSP